MHRLATGDARCLDLHTAGLHVLERATTVDGFTEDVHDTTEDAVADGDREDLAGGLDGLSLLDGVDVTEHHGADGVFVEVEGEAHGAVFETKDLVDGGVGETAHAGDAVADFDHATDGLGRQVGFERVEVFLQGRGDVGWIKRKCHVSVFFL